MNNKEEYFIFIDKKKLIASEENAGKIIGSVRKLVEEKIVIKNKVLKYDTLFKLLGSDKYFDNDDYYIKRTKLKRSKVVNR